MQPDPNEKARSSDADPTLADDQKDLGYYYDDSHGYETYGPEQPLTIWTIGHSTRDFAEFLELLYAHEIKTLADVRSFPGSSKYPQFNKETLEGMLPANGVGYVHLKQLGGRRKVTSGSSNTVWRNASFRGYADHMETAEFATGIEELTDIAEESRTAIMCSEAVWWRCHRSMISDYLKANGVTVIHILGPGKSEEHPYTSAANLVEGRLTYGPA